MSRTPTTSPQQRVTAETNHRILRQAQDDKALSRTLAIGFLLCCCLSSLCFGQSVHRSVLCNVVSSKSATGSESDIKFSVSVPGSQVSGLTTTPSQGPRRIIILLDSSKSMGESDSSMKLAMQVVKDFIEESPSTEQLALMNFSDQLYIDINLQSADSFAKSFADPKTTGDIKATGPTIFFQAMANAADYLHKSSAEGDSLFVISDGLDNASHISLQQLNDTLIRDNVRVYLFLLGTAVPEKARKQLQATIDVVDSTGGLTIGVRPIGLPLVSTLVPTPRYDLGNAELEKIRADVHTLHHLIEKAYKVEFDLQPPPERKRQLQVSLLSPDGTITKDTQARCPATVQP